MKDIEYYLSRGFDRTMAEYYVSGRKEITSVRANPDFTLTLTFDNGEKRLYDCKSFLEDGTVFEPLRSYDNFKRAYLDSEHRVAWDIDPDLDSNVVWNNKIDLCPDTCYIESVPLEKTPRISSCHSNV